MKKVLGIGILTAVFFTGCLKEGALKKPYTGFTPVDIGDGWTISTPTAENIDSTSLDSIYQDVYNDDATWTMKSMLVFRNGKLVAESYLKDDADRTKPDAIWSCTKQVNSIITGIAINQGYFATTDSIGKFLPEYISKYPDKKGITVKHLLTMNSGIDYDNGTNTDVLRKHETGDCIDYILSLHPAYAPGTNYKYKDGDAQLLSGVLQKATGKPLDEYGKEVLLDLLGVKLQWERYSDGVTLGAFGILTTPRELAKIGECVLDSGRHYNIQIIPLNWWHDMLSVQVPNADVDAAFGYLWWIIPDKGWYLMRGHGGQYVFLKPSKRLMIVITSLPSVDAEVFAFDKIVSLADKIDAAAQ